MKLKGFTMAEVLITIGIIGLVASMTLPSLINNAKNKQLEAAFKKQYSALSQAINHLKAQGVCLHPTDCIINGQAMLDYFAEIYKVNKRCDNMPSGLPEYDEWCFPKNQNDTKYTNYNKTSSYLNSSSFDDGQFYTMDGALITFEVTNAHTVVISFDVNGRAKGPNALGHDLFMFEIIGKDSDGFLLPMGAEGTTYEDNEDNDYCSKTSTSSLNGASCTIKAIYDPKYFIKLPK